MKQLMMHGQDEWMVSKLKRGSLTAEYLRGSIYDLLSRQTNAGQGQVPDLKNERSEAGLEPKSSSSHKTSNTTKVAFLHNASF